MIKYTQLTIGISSNVSQHIRKQASLVKMNQPVGDTFHTPANLKKDVIPRRIQNYVRKR